MRRAYLRISQKIHPDKLSTFADATKAFQACVRAYELICKPELRAMESDDSRDEEEVGDDDDEVVESTAQSQQRAGSSATHKAQKPRKTRQHAEARKRAGATKSKKESFPRRDPPEAKKKRTRVSRASSSSGSEDEKFQADTSDKDDELARGKPGARGKASKTEKKAKHGSKVQAARGDRFIDDDDDEGWWSSSSSSAAGGDEEESDFEQQQQQRQKPALPKFKKPRSNANCYRTPVTCPKCHAEWGAHLKAEGQEHTYSLFMQGVRQVHCLTCLFGDC